MGMPIGSGVAPRFQYTITYSYLFMCVGFWILDSVKAPVEHHSSVGRGGGSWEHTSAD